VDGAATADRLSVRQAYRSSPRRTPGRWHTVLDYLRRAVRRRRALAHRRSLVVAVGQAGNSRAGMLAHGPHCTGSNSRAAKVPEAGTAGAFDPPEVWTQTLDPRGNALQPALAMFTATRIAGSGARAAMVAPAHGAMERVTGIEPA